MKLIYLLSLLTFFFILSCDDTSTETDQNNNNIEDTLSINGITRIYYGPGTFSVNYDNPAEHFSLSILNENYVVHGSPTKLGVISATNMTLFQQEPSSQISLKTESPFNSTWLDTNNTYQSGAATGLNYVFVDDDHNSVFETVYLVKLNKESPANSSETYIVAKAVKEDGTSISFTDAKKVLDTLDN